MNNCIAMILRIASRNIYFVFIALCDIPIGKRVACRYEVNASSLHKSIILILQVIDMFFIFAM